MKKSNYQEDGKLTLKALARLKAKFGIKIYNPDGKLLYLLQKGDRVDYQKLLKKVK
ncbi:hypothetical protein ES708_16812 [subsurface metagenome]